MSASSWNNQVAEDNVGWALCKPDLIMQLNDRYFNDMGKLEYSSSDYAFIHSVMIRCLLSNVGNGDSMVNITDSVLTCSFSGQREKLTCRKEIVECNGLR